MQQHEVAGRLRQEGHRITPQRLAVLEIIAECGQHLTAEEIYAGIQARHPYMNIATVYRTLQWLQQVGLVAPLLVGGEPIRYEYGAGVHQHHHLICLRCGQEIQIGDEMLDKLKGQLLERYGFDAQLQHLGLTGYCDTCRRRAT